MKFIDHTNGEFLEIVSKEKYDALALWLERIKHAVELQAEDPALWITNQKGRPPKITAGEAYMQQALRDLHRVIEDGDEQALANIKDCAECASGKDLK